MDEIIVVGICIVLNAFFSAYEMAFVSISRNELRQLAKAGNNSAKTLLNLRENPERTLSIIQIGITLVGAVAAAIGGAGASETLEPFLIQQYGLSEQTAELLAVTMVVLPITYLSVVVGELVPKSLALRNPTKIVLLGAKALFVADRIFSPLVTVLERSTKLILLLFPLSKAAAAASSDQNTIDMESFSPAHRSFVINMAGIEKKQLKDFLLPWDKVIS
ncbi:MAG: DUF21 domain-containing protein, partial [Proteobacteria bacterium]